MEKDVTLSIHLTEDETDTIARAVLEFRGETFEAVGRARRNPSDPPQPEIGEELAIGRALSGLQHDVLEAARRRIERLPSS